MRAPTATNSQVLWEIQPRTLAVQFFFHVVTVPTNSYSVPHPLNTSKLD